MISFTKAHACGNDFLILDEAVAQRRHAQIARRLCARNTGIGADGIEYLDRTPDPTPDRLRRSGQPFLRLFNADGSEAELSGNGTRCVAAFLAHTEGLQHVTLGTHGGPRTCHVLGSTGSLYQIETEMGVPRVMPRTLSMEGLPDRQADLHGAMVNVGNPHYVLFVDTDDFSVAGLPWQELGARLSSDPRFPHGTNVEFVRVLAPDRIEFRIFERGCGPTTSSGTGTCASSAAAIALRGAAQELTAVAEGGSQHVRWPATTSQMHLTGPAELICHGQTFADEPAEDLAL